METGSKVKLESFRCFYCESQHDVMKRCVRCRNTLYCSRACQIKDWKAHQKLCFGINVTNKNSDTSTSFNKDIPNIQIAEENSSTNQTITSQLPICVKCNHKKHKITLNNVESQVGKILLEDISKQLRVPLSSLKLIGKGKLITENNIKDVLLKQKISLFQAFGEEAEDEDGLDASDIDAIMDELKVSRNKAVRSLRSCNGDLIDAIIELGNKI